MKNKTKVIRPGRDLTRFTVSLEDDLLRKFEKRMQKKKYANRSQAIRGLIRADLVQEEWEGGKEVAGAVALVYDHRRRELLTHLTGLQHDFQKLVLSSQHIHLDHDNCLEIIAVRGKAEEIKAFAQLLRACKGVKYGNLTMASTGARI